MKEKIFIIYDLKKKTQTEKVKITRRLYGYEDRSNYSYNYTRPGNLNKISYTKEKKMILHIAHQKDLPKLLKLFKELNINFEVART